MEKEITIVLADDHPLFRSGVKYELNEQDDIKVIGEAANGKEAVDLIRQLKPSIAVLDIQMPELTGLEVLKQIEAEDIQTNIILLTMIQSQQVFFDAIDHGVKGYVLKDDAVNDIINAVRAVSEGRIYISPSLSGLLVMKSKLKTSGEKTETLLADLTETQRKMLKLIADLKTNDEIAEELFISKRTVENNKGLMADKLNLESAKQLLKYAIKHKDELGLLS